MGNCAEVRRPRWLGEPHCWEEIKSIWGNIFEFGFRPWGLRSPEVGQQYEAYQARMNGGIAKEILARLSGPVTALDNRFGYDLVYGKLNEPGLTALHVCVWFLTGEYDPSQESLAIKRLYPGVVETATFMNPPKFRTIPEIIHTHGLVLVKTASLK